VPTRRTLLLLNPAKAAVLLGALSATLVAAAPVSAQAPSPDALAGLQPDSLVEGQDYKIYDRWGIETSLYAIVRSAVGDDVLLVGEEHDDMVGHALETSLLGTVLDEIGAPSGSGRTVVLSLEMFERDVQYILDEYLEGQISEQHFLRSARPWDHYEARYRPLVELAKERGTPIVAANAPRRYVSRVTSEGPESLASLSEMARGFLPPLPYPGPSRSYREQWEAIMDEAMSGHDAEPSGYEMNPNAIYSQALWDASMGHAVTQALVRHTGGFVVHFAGSFHVEKGTGIPERIADYRPGTRVTTIVMTKADDVDDWSAEEHGPLADYVVLTKKPEPASTGG